MMMWQMQDGMGWWMLFGGLLTIAFWAAVIGLAVWAVNRLTDKGQGTQDTREDPLDIARKRLARGEITTAQFEELRTTLARG